MIRCRLFPLIITEQIHFYKSNPIILMLDNINHGVACNSIQCVCVCITSCHFAVTSCLYSVTLRVFKLLMTSDPCILWCETMISVTL